MDKQSEQYIIVQAGGKGTRLKKLTKNKPKALVSISNLPMIFYLFNQYKDANFIIIGDYKCDVLEKYLSAFSTVKFKVINATGKTGTCAGIGDALKLIPENTQFTITWSDLIFNSTPDFSKENAGGGCLVGISQNFKCRWQFKDGKFLEEPSTQFGVAGLFVFANKKLIEDVPENGEFVRYLSTKQLEYKPIGLGLTKEFGLIEEIEKLEKLKCRPFNKITEIDNYIIKEGIDEQGKSLAKRERAWYSFVKDKNFKNLPIIYELEPLKMSKVNGGTVYSYPYLDIETKKIIIKDIVDCLKDLHKLGSVDFDENSYYEAYIGKTLKRLEKVKNLVPFACDEYININGQRCKNVFFELDKIIEEINKYKPKEFVFLHGDCTFSNILIDNNNNPVLIDPRGYFGNTELYGDVAYDWAKLYYSIVGNYDEFNLKEFDLTIKPDSVQLNIKSNRWEPLEDYFLELVKDDVSKEQLKLIHALIWLSLTTYAWDDYDSICGAFYNGVYLLNECDFMRDTSKVTYFNNTLRIINQTFEKLDVKLWDEVVSHCHNILENGGKIIASGLGKNVPICEKFVGTLNSFGLDARFLHTNTAIHGDLGIVNKKDLVFLLSKSGNTEESIVLANYLIERGCEVWLLSCNENCTLATMLEHKIILDLEHEGDLWDIAPNNSTTVFLMFLQGVAIELSKRNFVYLENFKVNHPGGSIGKKLSENKI